MLSIYREALAVAWSTLTEWVEDVDSRLYTPTRYDLPAVVEDLASYAAEHGFMVSEVPDDAFLDILEKHDQQN